MNALLNELYQEVILDHNRHPRHFYALDKATHEACGNNPLCGDEVKVYLHVKDDVIQDISFTGKGCAISMASASLMTDALIGKTLGQAQAIFEQFRKLVMEDASPENLQLDKLKVLAGVRHYPARVKCATLAWHTYDAAVHQAHAPVSTE